MNHKPLSFALIAALALTACKQDPAVVAAKDAEKRAEAEVAAQAEAEAKLPQPDMKKSLASYKLLDDDGSDSIFLYQAVSNMPPDFEKLAGMYSKEYREASDSFRKQELLTALKPQMQQQIADAQSSPYAYIKLDYNNNLEAYDFQRKGFPVFSFGENTQKEVLGPYYSSTILNWINKHQVSFAPVANESAAREIEGLRTKGRYNNPPRLKVYFFAQSANLNSNEINAYVTRVQIVDKSGRVLAEYGPDGSVRAQATGEAQNSGNAAADAAAALLGG